MNTGRLTLLLVLMAGTSGCFEGLVKKYTRLKADSYPKMRQALDSNPSVVVIAAHGMHIDAPHLRNTAKEMRTVDHARLSGIGATYSKELGNLLSKTYPLTKLRYDASVSKLKTGNLGGIIGGAEPEYDIPASIKEDYIIQLNTSGNYYFTPSERRNGSGEILGRLACDVGVSLSLIDVKTRKEIGVYRLGDGAQTWEDVTENAFRTMADTGALDAYLATKAHDDMFTDAKEGIKRFVFEIKKAQPANHGG